MQFPKIWYSASIISFFFRVATPSLAWRALAGPASIGGWTRASCYGVALVGDFSWWFRLNCTYFFTTDHLHQWWEPFQILLPSEYRVAVSDQPPISTNLHWHIQIQTGNLRFPDNATECGAYKCMTGPSVSEHNFLHQIKRICLFVVLMLKCCQFFHQIM